MFDHLCLFACCSPVTFQVQTVSPLRTPEYAARMVFIAEASRVARVPQRTPPKKVRKKLNSDCEWAGRMIRVQAYNSSVMTACLLLQLTDAPSGHLICAGEERERDGDWRTRAGVCGREGVLPQLSRTQVCRWGNPGATVSSGPSPPCIYERGHVSQ